VPIPKPDTAEIATLAARIGYRVNGEELEQYTAMIADML
jgi:hypothetical protein